VASPYRVDLELFEGPLDLLLHLIKKYEVEVTDIPIAAVTEQYLSYLDLMRELDLNIAGEFLVMAATLTLIKSRMLLPQPEADGDEEGEDPRADLVRRLMEYQRYREAAAELAARPLLGRDVFTRDEGAPGIDLPAESPQVRATVWQLMEALRAVIERARPEAVHEVVSEPVSLRDRVQALLHTLSVARSVRFDSLFDEDATRPMVIVTFLALLELMKIGAVEAVQEEGFGPIAIILVLDDVTGVALDTVDTYDGREAREDDDG